MSFDKAAEFLLHYRNFDRDYKIDAATFRDPNWKEINETYLPPNPNKFGIVSMPREEYISTILGVSNETLAETPYKLICVKDEIIPREDTMNFLLDGFSISVENDGTKSQEELFLQITEKMELIFKKVRREE